MTCADDAKCVMIERNAICVCDDGFEEVETQGCVGKLTSFCSCFKIHCLILH